MSPLYPHQLAAVDRALQRGGSLALFFEPGLGKTRTCLDIYTRLKTPTLKLLVVCPRSVMEPVWGEEITQCTSYTWTTPQTLNCASDIVVVNFERLIRPATQHLLRYLFSTPLMLVIDESSRLKDARSLTTKTLLALAERCQYRVICSGTPAPNGLHELWGQLRVIDPAVFHRSFYAWRREWFHLARYGKTCVEPPPSRQAMQQLFQSGWQWDITPIKREQLLARCAPLVSWVRKTDALQLPEKITTIRYVTLNATELQAYREMERQLVVEFQSETVTAEIALTKLLRLRQLSSGFVYGPTVRHHTGTSRLTVLRETLEEFGDQPIIIWCHFKEEVQQLVSALGDQAVTLYSETKDQSASLAAFGRTARYLIAHPRSAGHGLTLTQSSTCIWYSLDWSLEAHLQANDRIHRIGQTHNCLYVYLIAKGLIDDEIWRVLHQKTTLQAVLDRFLRNTPPLRAGPRHQAALAKLVGVPSE